MSFTSNFTNSPNVFTFAAFKQLKALTDKSKSDKGVFNNFLIFRISSSIISFFKLLFVSTIIFLSENNMKCFIIIFTASFNAFSGCIDPSV